MAILHHLARRECIAHQCLPHGEKVSVLDDMRLWLRSRNWDHSLRSRAVAHHRDGR